MTREERERLLSGDLGRCTDLLTFTDSQGVRVLLRCSKSAWHRHSHRANLSNGAYARWPGDGSLASAGLPPLERAALDVLRARARAMKSA